MLQAIDSVCFTLVLMPVGKAAGIPTGVIITGTQCVCVCSHSHILIIIKAIPHSFGLCTPHGNLQPFVFL